MLSPNSVEDIDGGDKIKLPSSVLFLCTQNAVRSPMAAGIMKSEISDKIFIDSAGIQAIDIDGYAITVMDEIDIDISNHVSLSIEANTLAAFDLVVCFSNVANQYVKDICRTVATKFVYWPVYDPVNQAEKRDDQLIHYRQLRDQLKVLLKSKFQI